MKKFAEIYISVDVEAVGPIPGPYSMSSIGASLAGARTVGNEFILFDHTDKNNVFYRELAPISDNFIPSAINVGLLDGFDTTIPDEDGQRHFDWMKAHGEDPQKVMQDFQQWTNAHKEAQGARPIFMAFPASFDWTFVYWYFQNFGVTSPFGFSGVLDLKTLFSAYSGNGIGKSGKRFMPKHLFADLPHTHRADDDAIEQGILGMNMLKWQGKY